MNLQPREDRFSLRVLPELFGQKNRKPARLADDATEAVKHGSPELLRDLLNPRIRYPR